ncbi:MAG TPA: DUF3352 domain-containing protein [Baekduia sp.]|nr:DUF3352 domain-containing protein [Baekduia sp.]
MRARPRLAALLSCAALVPLAGCGDDGAAGGDGPDPAASMPARAPVYVEAVVRPEGEQRSDAEAVLRKVLRGRDPGDALIGLLEGLGGRGRDVDFRQDVEPWLGERVGLALTSLQGAEPEVVVAVATKDADKARATLEKEAPRTEREHAGVTYRVDDDGFAGAVVDDVLLLGDEPAFKAAVDARKGDSLAEADSFERAREEAGEDGLGFLYADVRRIFDVAVGSGELPQELSGPLRGLVGGAGAQALGASLEVDADVVRVNAATIAAEGKDLPEQAGDPAAALEGLPAGSILALGLGDVGKQLDGVLEQLSSLGGAATGGVSPDQLLDLLRAQTGVDVQRDLLAWMGEGALFVRGSGLKGLGGALVVRSKDPAASRAAIGKIERALRQFGLDARVDGSVLTVELGILPSDLKIAARGDRFVIAVGDAALQAALASGERLGADAAFKQAAGALQDVEPSLFLDVPRVVELVGAAFGDDAGFREVRPYLQALGALVGGTKGDGDVQRSEAALLVP